MSNYPSAKGFCKCRDPHRGRNLVVCIDGTTNKYGAKWTNVLELFSRLETEGQMRYYKNGIGARDFSLRPSLLFDNTVDQAIAWNVERGIQLAYHWLSERYKPGDRIFLFGFSRGAFQVRSLAAMIDAVGLVPEGHEEQIPYAYKLYMRLKTASQEETTRELVETFKDKLSTANVQVHFVGVWDTVSSVGLIRGKEATLSNSSNHACIFRQALALDECRVKFQPECISKNNSDPLPSNSKEVWFAGSHSEVGGVHSLMDKALEMRNPALSWMQNEAILAGLLFKECSGEWDTNDLGKRLPERSLKGSWWFAEYFPVLRLSRKHPDKTTRSLHRGRGRVIYTGQKIHASVAFCAPEYVPRASFGDDPDSTQWKDFVAKGLAGTLAASPNWQCRIEMDLFDVSASYGLLESLANIKLCPQISEDVSLHTMKRLTFISGLRGGLKAIAAFHNVKDALEQFLEFEEPTMISSIPKTPLLFLATLRLVVRLVSSHSGTTSKTEAAKKVIELNSWGSEVLARPIIYRAVVNLLGSKSGRIRVASAKTVTSLSTLDSCRKEISKMETGPISSLVQMLGTRYENGPAVNALAALQETNFKDQLFPAIKSLLKLLKGAESVTAATGPDRAAAAKAADNAAAAASVLSLLARDDTARSELLKSKEVIPALRKMLDRDSRSWSAASTTLICLTSGQDFNHIIKETNPVNRLVQLLKNENYNYGPTADELVVIAPSEIARASMIILGAVTRLQQLLRTDNPGPATSALIKLAAYEELRRAMYDNIIYLIETLGEKPGPAVI
ncbi:hypothetical protein GALMADRAFT_407064 [Galerina marginata CBS 339.88]|uniref:T6SS Phospholipase effector Tle1-like catalytic domain-containing protein n=1 Tax=Galerina marginata (strain CBS 339.88) TaxID=685588 RepID=A0A067TCC1_GALM3|nr:hypothetical protein GALMADRAFT_407064 [Galerina marginata CBS 339.88]